MELKRDKDKYGGLMPRCGGGIKNPAKESPDQSRLNHMQSKLNHLYASTCVISSCVAVLKNLFSMTSKSWTADSSEKAMANARAIELLLQEIRDEVKEIVIEGSELK